MCASSPSVSPVSAGRCCIRCAPHPATRLSSARGCSLRAVRLIDLGCFRPGSDSAEDEFGSHGLTTIERRHVHARHGALVFDFVGKAGVEQSIEIDDEDVIEVLGPLRRGRDRGARLLMVREAGRPRALTPAEVNDHIREVSGLDVTAKDIRTWHATVTAAAALATQPLPQSERARRARVSEAVAASAELLGNTPAVARSSYVDPRVIDLFEAGTVLDPLPGGPDALDRALAALLHP